MLHVEYIIVGVQQAQLVAYGWDCSCFNIIKSSASSHVIFFLRELVLHSCVRNEPRPLAWTETACLCSVGFTCLCVMIKE
jgi:hypothetical protein